MSEFDALWRSSLRFRRASLELEPLLHDVHNAFGDEAALRAALERLLLFLTSDYGRTDANCCVTDQFISSTEARWQDAPEALRAILEDMGGTLHDSIYAPDIAKTFEATPEQLLQRLRNLR